MNLSWVLLQTLALTAGPQVQVQTLSGEPLIGTLESLSATQLVLAVSGENRELPLATVVDFSPIEPPSKIADRPSAWIDLTDGTQLLAAGYTVEKGVLKASLLGGGTASGPVKAAARVRLKHQTDKIAEQWQQILAVKASGDLLIVRKGDSIDYLEGVLGDVTAEQAAFKLDGDNISVKLPKIEGLVYFRPGTDDEAPVAVGRVIDAAGGESQFSEFTLFEGVPTWTTPAGVRVSGVWKQLAKVDFSRGKIASLADLKLDSVEMPRLLTIRPERSRKLAEEFMKPRFDQGPRGEALRVGGKPFARGAAVHSQTKLVYRIAGKYKRFSALVGLDDNESGGGSARLVLEGDGRSLLDERYFSGAAARPIEIDVSGVKVFTIRVEYGDESKVSDCLDLCEARVSK